MFIECRVFNNHKNFGVVKYLRKDTEKHTKHLPQTKIEKSDVWIEHVKSIINPIVSIEENG